MSHVQLAVSSLGGVPGATAYHSSLLLDGEEFCFSNAGITRAPGPVSHHGMGKVPRILDLGISSSARAYFMAGFGVHFRPGTYDLVRKNCNSFADLAMYFFVGQRLDAEYCSVERLGLSMPPALFQVVSVGWYVPNPQAADFDLEALIQTLSAQRAGSTPAITAGTMVAPAEAPRAGAELPQVPHSEAELPHQVHRGCQARERWPSAEEDVLSEWSLAADPQEPCADEALARALQAEENARALASGAVVFGGSTAAHQTTGWPTGLPQAGLGRGMFLSQVDESVRRYQQEVQLGADALHNPCADPHGDGRGHERPEVRAVISGVLSGLTSSILLMGGLLHCGPPTVSAPEINIEA